MAGNSAEAYTSCISHWLCWGRFCRCLWLAEAAMPAGRAREKLPRIFWVLFKCLWVFPDSNVVLKWSWCLLWISRGKSQVEFESLLLMLLPFCTFTLVIDTSGNSSTLQFLNYLFKVIIFFLIQVHQASTHLKSYEIKKKFLPLQENETNYFFIVPV